MPGTCCGSSGSSSSDSTLSGRAGLLGGRKLFMATMLRTADRHRLLLVSAPAAQRQEVWCSPRAFPPFRFFFWPNLAHDEPQFKWRKQASRFNVGMANILPDALAPF